MDRISQLSDDLILKILSFPPTQVAITTSLLSKRWRHVWKHVPKIEYCAPQYSTFIQNFLLLHEAPVLETMNVELAQHHRPTDIEIWFIVAIPRGVRTLQFQKYLPGSEEPIRLPGSLYTCQTLVTLRLLNTFIVDVPLTIRFPSLKTLMLTRVDFESDEIVPRILSGCPVLEDLTIIRVNNGNVKTFKIMVPSLLRLAVWDSDYGPPQVSGNNIGFVIRAPSLTSLTVVSKVSWVCSLVNMPNLVKANIELPPTGDSKKLLKCLTSAKHLSLCTIPSKVSYPTSFFYHLVSLELCASCSVWYCLIIRQTPKLRVLRFQPINRCCHYIQIQWQQPTVTYIPPCLISSLETVEWIYYKGTQTEKGLVMYFLENSRQLKKVSITSLESINLNEKYEMLVELASAQRISSECRLLFT